MIAAPRSLAAALALGLALLAAPAARADDDDSGFLYPQVGLGAGGATVGGRSSSLGSLDFNFGNEWEVSGVIGSGFVLGLELEAGQWEGGRGWSRFSVTSLWSLSLGYFNPWPFLRVGVGPALTFTMIDPDRATRVGAGVTLEAATGFRSVVELYAQTSAVVDSTGLARSVTAGFRLNVWVFDLLFGGGGGGHHRGGHRSRPHRPSRHRAVPVGS